MYFVAIAILVILITLIIQNCRRPKNFPPGPLNLPLIGSWYDIPARGVETKIPGWRKRYGNIIGLKIGFRYLVIVCGNEDIVAGLKHPNFQSRLHTSTLTDRSFRKVLGIFFGDGDQWSEVKRFTLRFLGQVSNNRLEVVMQEEMSDWFKAVTSGQVHEINSKFLDFSIKSVINVFIGKNGESHYEEVDKIRELTYRAFKNGRITGIEIVHPQMKFFFSSEQKVAAVTYTQKFFRRVIAERRKTFNPNNIVDFIDAFLLEQQKEKAESPNSNYYSDEELQSVLLDLVQAASESSANTAGFVMMYVAMNPQVQDKLHQELDRVVGRERFPTLDDRPNLPYVDAVLSETMRINPVSGIGAGHIATKDTDFANYRLPQGTLLFFGHQDTLNDPTIFNEPKQFRPERFLKKEEIKIKMTNFGLGKRACIGEILAKNSLYLFIAYLFQKYSLSFPKGYEHPDTTPEYGFINSPKPYKLILTERPLK
ncbi:hypothetical protein V9T40_001617 [Parthenolecanium corni]|uniref:Cytochrome P450 n=1 Tax=Parthenolecanium corni TaxID=536013 RepID=A0AAN9Y5M1_9HEMI